MKTMAFNVEEYSKNLRDIKESEQAIKLNDYLLKFLEESLLIDGLGLIEARCRTDYFKRLKGLLKLKELRLDDIIAFNVEGPIRDRPGMNVKVGTHNMPCGGLGMDGCLNEIVMRIGYGHCPAKIHDDFEALHPFVCGNGTTGRAIWLWQMVNQFDYDLSLGFLHKYYFQKMEAK